MSNFHSLVAIIAGLRSDWVTKSMRRLWNRVGIWEMRVFEDLVEYTRNSDDFNYIRRTIESMVEAKPLELASHSVTGTDSHKSRTGDAKAAPPSACVPFIGGGFFFHLIISCPRLTTTKPQGVYLSQLHRLGKMPDLIDPSAPNEAVSVDPISGNFDALAHPEVFASLRPLPASMQLEPLINVQKQRLIARVIKSLVSGQHLASRVQFSVDKKLFQRCLKLRGLDVATLQRALTMYPEVGV